MLFKLSGDGYSLLCSKITASAAQTGTRIVENEALITNSVS
jgi:hypothetical protein